MSFVAVVLTLAAPRIFLIVQRVLEVLWVKFKSNSRRGNDNEQANIRGDAFEPNEARGIIDAPAEPAANTATLHQDNSDLSQRDTAATGHNLDDDTIQVNCRDRSSAKKIQKS
jgi:hypothetical protein